MKTLAWFATLIAVAALGCATPGASSQPDTTTPTRTLSAPPGPFVEAYLYNPTPTRIVVEYPYERPSTSVEVKPVLVLSGRGFPDDTTTLQVVILSSAGPLEERQVAIEPRSGRFEVALEPKAPYPTATRITWTLDAGDGDVLSGEYPLSWSRFHGTVEYLSGQPRSTYIELHPTGFTQSAVMVVPVADDGSFDASLPARVFAVVNVNGAGYGYDAMERWAWDYDLTRAREDTFTIGRTELYAMTAFCVLGGGPTVFVTFRPSALSRVLQFDADGNGILVENEYGAMVQALGTGKNILAPELTAGDIEVWLDGEKHEVVQLSQVPEASGGGAWQVQYVLQLLPEKKPTSRVRHELKLHVRSTETLRGKEVIDFGEGSVGFYCR